MRRIDMKIAVLVLAVVLCIAPVVNAGDVKPVPETILWGGLGAGIAACVLGLPVIGFPLIGMSAGTILRGKNTEYVGATWDEEGWRILPPLPEPVVNR